METEAKLNELAGKYEAIMVIAKEARRINNRLRGQNVGFKVTSLAMERYCDGNVKFEYWRAPEPSELSLDAMESMSHSATAAGLPGAIEAAAAAEQGDAIAIEPIALVPPLDMELEGLDDELRVETGSMSDDED